MITKSILPVFTLFFSVTAYSQPIPEDSVAYKCSELLMTGKAEDKEQAKHYIRLLAVNDKEATMVKAATLAFIMGEYPLCDSISKIAAQKFPYGETARQMGYAAVAAKKGSGKEAEEAYAQWITRFPDTTADHEIYNEARKHIAEQYAAERNYTRTTFWTSHISDNWEKGKQEIDNAIIALNNGDTAAALSFQQTGIERLRAATRLKGFSMKWNYYMYLDKYARLLHREKKYSKALTAISEVYNNKQQSTPALEKIYAAILTANGRGKEVLPVLEKLFKTGQGDEALLQVLQLAYKQNKGNLQGYDSYVAQLKAEMKKMVKAKLPPEKLHLPAPEFTLSDTNATNVSLAQLKGKVVILDFWATWCGPCKRSFPAMKQAVQRYQADTAVQFLFIDCMERISNYTSAVKDFITANHYPFRVLFDDKPDKVFEQYGVKGIPAKFIIDGNGIIRYKLTGFEEGDDAAVEELSTLIEMAKKPA